MYIFAHSGVDSTFFLASDVCKSCVSLYKVIGYPFEGWTVLILWVSTNFLWLIFTSFSMLSSCFIKWNVFLCIYFPILLQTPDTWLLDCENSTLWLVFCLGEMRFCAYYFSFCCSFNLSHHLMVLQIQSALLCSLLILCCNSAANVNFYRYVHLWSGIA